MSWKRLVLVALVAVVFASFGSAAEAGGDGEYDMMEHIADGSHMEYPLLPFLPLDHPGFTLPAPLTKVMVWMTGVTVLLIGLFWATKPKDPMVPSGMYNLLEILVVFVRDEIAVKNIGEKHGLRYTPFLLTMFFFILASNLTGLVPGGVTVTGNINVTAALAIITLVVMQAGGIKEYGFAHHVKNLIPSGVPAFLIPVMFIVEIMGLLAKPFALCVRLFANMTAGHVIILSLIGLIFTLGPVFAPVSVGFALFIFLLELLVALLQAYIFTMLSALFIGMTVHVSH